MHQSTNTEMEAASMDPADTRNRLEGNGDCHLFLSDDEFQGDILESPIKFGIAVDLV